MREPSFNLEKIISGGGGQGHFTDKIAQKKLDLNHHLQGSFEVKTEQIEGEVFVLSTLRSQFGRKLAVVFQVVHHYRSTRILRRLLFSLLGVLVQDHRGTLELPRDT